MLTRLIMAAIAAACLVAVTPAEAPAVPGLVAAVKADIGKNPTGWKSRWCAVYLKAELKALGYKSAAKKLDARAASFLKLKHTGAAIGTIAVLTRRGGHHVGVVTGFPRRGYVELVSGNSGPKPRKVRRGVYPMSRVIAFVTP